MSKDLKKRIITSLVLAPLVLFAIIMGGLWYFALVAVMAVAMAWEWERMIYRKFTGFGVGIAVAALAMLAYAMMFRNFIGSRMCAEGASGLCPFFAGVFVVVGLPLLMALVYYRLAKFKKKANAGFIAAGVPYILLPVASLGLLGTDCYKHLVLFLFLTVWATDVGGYAFGMTIRGPKFFPKISPKKTWAGVFGGIFLACLVGAWFGFFEGPVKFVLIGAVLAIAAIAGDLFESWVKRRLFIKDSSNLIPGHGGLFDRIDGLLFAAPVMLLIKMVVPF
ncbi:MAG: phosphatidate cytidylyltransferase [Alphaproteobacteria bacterium]|nr:phosphatidate cytidylyltransferase [Alphaproteobacteria bacterium]